MAENSLTGTKTVALQINAIFAYALSHFFLKWSIN